MSTLTSNIEAPFNAFSTTDRLGSTGWPQFWSCDDDGLFDAATPYLDSLTAEGYDLIMLDFIEGAGHIQRNAYLLMELIQLVNANKVGNEGNIIIGASMGGQVVRYALTHMEHHNIPHCTRLNVSFDSPWKGAHIPLALQCFLDYSANHGGSAKARETLDNLHKPAPKQLLNYHIWKAKNSHRTITGSSQKTITFDFNHQFATCPERDLMIQELVSQGDYPRKCRNIAIVNGNDQGNQEFTAGQQFIDHRNDRCVGFRIQNDLWAGNSGTSFIAILNAAKGADKHFYRVKNMIDIYNAPASKRDDMTEVYYGIKDGLRSNMCGTSNVHLVENESGFIPSASAIGLDHPNWHYKLENIDPVSSFLSGLTPFDSYVAAKNNSEFHVLTTNENMRFFIKEVRRGEDRLGQDNGTTLTKAWNNPFENNNLNGIDINNGGTLFLNANRHYYNGGAQYPLSPNNSLSRVFLGSGCNPDKVLNINSGGVMELGANDASDKKAYLYIQSGANVNLNSGGSLIIHPGSKIYIQNGGTLKLADNVVLNNAQIIVEDGGELIYESAASLDFNQSGSSLLIQGKLRVKAGAIISVNSKGKLIFDQDIPWITDPITGNPMRDINSYLEIESGAKLHLIGTNPSFKNQTLLEIRKETIFKDADQDIFAEVIIQNGAVDIAPQAFLFIASPINIIDAEIRGTNPLAYHGGIRIWNNNTINYLRRVSIKNGMPGVLVSGLGSRGHTEFRDCNINNNMDGIKWNGGFHKALNCSFSNNVRHAIYGLNLNGTSEIINSNFSFTPLTNISANGSAIELQGQQGSLLQVKNTTIDGFAQGINLDDMDLRAECNTIKNNLIGIKSNNAMVYLNNDASNTIKHNETAAINMIGDEAQGSGIYLFEGNNKFQLPLSNISSYHHVLGLWDCHQPLSDYTPNGYLDFNYNEFQTPASATISSLFSLSLVDCNINTQYSALNVDLSQNNSSSPTCGNNSSADFHPSLATLSEFPPTFGKVTNGTVFNATPLSQALDQTLSKLSFNDNIRNDKEALTDLILILQGTITDADTNTQAYLNLAYRVMHQALNQVYQAGQLIHNEGEPNPPVTELADVCTIANDLILPLSATDSLDHASIFQLNLDKVHAYRVAGHYAEASGILANRTNWTFNFTQSQRAGYWNCVCNQESDYYNEEIPAEEFDYGLDLCRQTFAGYTYKRAAHMEEVRKELAQDEIMAYPQPVSNLLYLETSRSGQTEVNISVLNLSGQTLSQTTVKQKAGKFEIDMQHLKPGIYIVRIKNAHINESIKVLKD